MVQIQRGKHGLHHAACTAPIGQHEVDHTDQESLLCLADVDDTDHVVGIDDTDHVVGMDDTDHVVGIDDTDHVVGIDDTDHVVGIYVVQDLYSTDRPNAEMMS